MALYLPRHFEQPDVDALRQLVRDYPLATLISCRDGDLTANHIPFELSPETTSFGTLRGHVARANPVWRDAAASEVLVLFHGPESYVSPSWYASKADRGMVVPTWNYLVVHAYGRLRAVEDRAWLRGLVERLTDTQEAGRPDRWRVSDAPPDYIDAMVGAIVGIEIEVTRVLGKWKNSQNRGEPDRRGVAKGLRGEGTAGASALASDLEREPR